MAAAKQTEDQAVQRQKTLEQRLKTAQRQRIADVTAAKQTEDQAVQRQKTLEQQLKAAGNSELRIRRLPGDASGSEAEDARLKKLVAELVDRR